MSVLSKAVFVSFFTFAIESHASTNKNEDNIENLISDIEKNPQNNLTSSTSNIVRRVFRINSERDLSVQANENRDGYLQQNWIQAFPIPKSAMRISSDFGSREMAGRFENHQGIDFAAPTGTPIYASGAGIVTKAGWGNGYGQYVEINHGNGYLTRYGHASQLHVQVGDRVNSGELIANVGCTGRCTGPHLHYEVVKDGQRRNPASYLALLP